MPPNYLRPACPLGGVEGFEVVRVGQRDPGRLLVHELLHLPDDGLALLRIDGTRLLDRQLVVLSVRPVGLVEVADLRASSGSSMSARGQSSRSTHQTTRSKFGAQVLPWVL